MSKHLLNLNISCISTCEGHKILQMEWGGAEEKMEREVFITSDFQ